MSVLAPPRLGSTEGRKRVDLWVDVPFTKAPASPTGDIELSGYASTWGLDRDEEMVAQSAFEKSLSAYLSKNPIVLWQHNQDWPIGTVKSGRTDDTGLYVAATIPNPGPESADWQKGAYTAIKNGIVRTFSIGGYMLRDVKPGPDGPVFIIAEVELMEISCVSIPANADSLYEAAVKALKGIRPQMSEKALGQMEQLIGFKAVTDPELDEMGEPERDERYAALSALFERSYGVPAPERDSWKRIDDAMRRGANPVAVARATSLLAKAFYFPEPAQAADVKAGRAISAANKEKLRAALALHEDIEKHLTGAADEMIAAAKSHADAVSSIKDVVGEEPGPDTNEDDSASEEEGEGAAKGAKQLTGDVGTRLREAGLERFGSAAQEESRVYVYVDDFDLDEGFVVYCIYGPDEESYQQVSFTRDADGGVSLAAGSREVSPQRGYVPKGLGRPRGLPPLPIPPSVKSAEAEAEAAEAIDSTEDEDILLANADYTKDLIAAAIYHKNTGLDAKGALALANLPIAGRDTGWDAGAAKRRVHAWAAREGDQGGYDPAKMSRAYLWRDNGADASLATSYRFIVADMVDGALTYVPRAAFAAANVVSGGRGGTADEVASAIKPLIKTLYARLAKKFDDDTIKVPWED